MIGGRPGLATALLVVAVGCSDDSTAPVEAPIPTSVVVSTASLRFSSLGETAQLTATVHDQNGQAMAGATVAWVSANAAVATVDGNGLVSATGQGATNIVVTAGSTASASVGVMVEQVPHTVVLSQPPDSLAVGDSIRMTAEAFDALSNTIPDVTFEWSSSDTTIATVDQGGWVRARAGGSAEITVAAGTTASAAAEITAVQVPNAIMLSEPPDSLAVGDSIRMTAEVFDGLGNLIADITLEWSSSDTMIVTVDRHGWVRARGGGSAVITVAAGATASAVAEIAAVQVPHTVVLSTPRDSLAVGDSIQMTAEALDGLGNPIANVTLRWSSSDTTIATVTQEGWVRARSAGSAEITVRVGDLSAFRSLVIYRDKDDPDERAVLEAFYNATNGPEWKNSANWLSDKPLAQWTGIATDADGAVVELRFRQNGLSGKLPAELGRLSNLEILSLWGEWEWGSSLTGPIPRELAGLSKLRILNLGNNQLTGEIPPELANLTNLTELSLVQNKLTGPVPPELGRLANLEELSLATNRLTGEIPPDIWNLVELTELHLAGNDLTGELPPDIGNLAKLKKLWLGNTNLTGKIPPEIGNLAELEILSLRSTGVTGPIPPQLGEILPLRWIWMTDNDLTGPIPPELGSLHNLEILYLDRNRLSGPIPPELGDLSKLEILSLGYNALIGPIPAELGKLTLLTELGLDDTRLEGPIPPELGNLASLRTLAIQSDFLTGPIPPELGRLRNLTTLYLIGYGISGSIPLELWTLSKLQRLTFAYTGLTGSIPPQIGNLIDLRVLQLVQAPGDYGTRGAGFTGTIPSELGRLSDLSTLRIGHHAFTGPLPPELGNLSNLRNLIIAQAQGGQSRDDIGLTGAIPEELGKLKSLEKLWLDSNHLSGPVAAELGSLAGLRDLRLGNNDLKGRVPDTFLDLDLEQFQWHNNPLCLPATPTFRAWRERIRTAIGPYCAAGATAAAHWTDGLRTTANPIAVEPLARCTVLSGSGITETGVPKPAEFPIWTGPGGAVIHEASIECPSHRPDPP